MFNDSFLLKGVNSHMFFWLSTKLEQG